MFINNNIKHHTSLLQTAPTKPQFPNISQTFALLILKRHDLFIQTAVACLEKFVSLKKIDESAFTIFGTDIF